MRLILSDFTFGNRIALLAPSFHEAREFATRAGLPGSAWFFLSEPKQLHGTRNVVVVGVGRMSNKDWLTEEMKEMLFLRECQFIPEHDWEIK